MHSGKTKIKALTIIIDKEERQATIITIVVLNEENTRHEKVNLKKRETRNCKGKPKVVFVHSLGLLT